EQVASGGLSISGAHFINIVFLLCGTLLMLMALLRFGRFITLVPNVVISGFMSGIALLIWLDQVKVLFGWGGKIALGGPLVQNLGLTLITLSLIFALAPLMRRIVGPRSRFLPATLLAIIIVTLLANFFQLPVECVQLSGGISSFSDLTRLIQSQIPTEWTLPILTRAFPFALQLAMLCYLDTLLTSLVVDKMSGSKTRQDKELFAQGLANSAIALVGGIPGAQATIRSVLMLKEKASLRISGIMVGIFVLIEMILFQDLINLIPKAVFVGVLIKVGYDVFDFKPLRLYAKELANKRAQLFEQFFSRHDDEPIFVTNRELLIIVGSAGITVMFDLNTAVIGFTSLFYLHNKVLNRKNPMRDLMTEAETDVFAKQN
ncbi:MAG: hypothetical protein L3J63_07810, partial [Geopsychrobacter sp.]|nr:hypothetical protein [Geopsychrobacter sp.]